ncbi:MAG TPA: hypothetical protein V6D12_09780 [Candidatus Obscuribacterales bacterium]
MTFHLQAEGLRVLTPLVWGHVNPFYTSVMSIEQYVDAMYKIAYT